MGRRPCCSKEGLNRGAWTAMEDKTLRDYIKVHGEGKWRDLPKSAGLKRCGKSCRLRWLNYLRPDIKRGNITRDEEDLIIRLHKLLGNRWSLIAGRLPGRTDNEIKNYWNTNIGKKVLQGHPVSSISTTSHRKSSNQTTKENPSPTTRRSRSIGLPLLPNLVSSSSSSCVVRTKASRCTKVFISSLEPQNTYQFNSESKPSGGGGQEPSTVGHQAFHCDAKVVGPGAGAGAGPGPNQDPEPLDAYISVSQFISTGDNNPSDYMVDFEMDTKFLSDFLNTDLIEPLCDVDNGLQLRVEPKGDNTSSSYPNSDQTFFLFSNELLLDSDLQSMAAAVAPLPCTGMDWLQDQ